MGKWRALVLFSLSMLMVAHFVQWRITGSTISPIEPSETMYTLQNGAINAGFIFFALAILATLALGRFVCGWGCHIVALQDLCAWLLNRFGLKPRPFRSRLLVYVPVIVAVYMFVWPTILRFIIKPPNEPLFPQFTNHIITTEFWATFPPFWVAVPFLFICGFVTVYFLGSKGFCTYACPYGGFFGIADKVAPGRIRVNDSCDQCGHCTAVCTSNVIVHAEVKEYGMVTDPGCMKCMDCVSACPKEALYFGFGKPAIGVKSSLKKNYSLKWGEEAAAAVIFFLSFMAVWDVYQIVPMLMALGIASVTTYLAIRAAKMLRAHELSFYGFPLKTAGTIKMAGWAFLAFAVVWIGLNVHSGWIRYNERAGSVAFFELQIPDELALANVEPGQWLSQSDRANIDAGLGHFNSANNLGLLTNSDTAPKLAWLEYLNGNAEKAATLLESAARHQNGNARALSLYYRGAILNRLNRPVEALASLDASLDERPDLTTAFEEKGESLWRLGQKEEALSAWMEAVKRNPNLPLTFSFLSAAGREDTAVEYRSNADRSTPADPYFHWMLGLRLQNLGFGELAESHFSKAAELNPAFHLRRDPMTKGKRQDRLPN